MFRCKGTTRNGEQCGRHARLNGYCSFHQRRPRTTDDFRHGDKVIYVPNHANGSVTHPDCQNGVVSSVNEHWVFVKYDCLACIMVTGDEPYTAQATSRDNLVRRLG